jgi:ATP adenylyltransferase
MKHLWAPWRIDYVAGPKDDDCIFCAALARRDDRRNLVLYRGTRCFVMLNRYPYNSGHLMVAPVRHTGDLSELDPDTLLEIMTLTIRMKGVLETVMQPAGFNMGFNCGRPGGAGVEDHAHMHVVPRWSGDTNFMTVLGDTRVVPQALETLYDELAAVLAGQKE